MRVHIEIGSSEEAMVKLSGSVTMSKIPDERKNTPWLSQALRVIRPNSQWSPPQEAIVLTSDDATFSFGVKLDPQSKRRFALLFPEEPPQAGSYTAEVTDVKPDRTPKGKEVVLFLLSDLKPYPHQIEAGRR